MDRRLTSLDGLRGFAAVVVLPYHVIFAPDRSLMERALYTPASAVATQPYDLWVKFWVTLLNGHAAVVLFFMLSGCVLVQSARADLMRYDWPRAFAAFLVRRVLRLMPALVVCVAVMWALQPPLDVTILLQNVSLYASDINGVTWTLRVEMLVAPIIFVAGAVTLHNRDLGAAGFLALSILAAAFPLLAFGNAEIARNLVYFAFGVMVPTTIGSFTSSRLAKVPFWLIVVCFLFARRIVIPFEAAILAQAVIGFALLSRAYYSPPQVLSEPLAQFFGRISYSFYLWNMLFVNVLTAWSPSYPWLSRYPVEAALPLSLAFGLATIPIAMLSERFLERPGIAAGRTLSDWILGRHRVVST